MGKVKVFTDSTSDLSEEILAEYDVSVVPLYVSFNDRSYKDGVEISTEGLFKKVGEFNRLPKTSAPSPQDFYDAFEPYIQAGKDIIYIGLSSELSATIQNAALAAERFPAGRVEVIDSLNLSTGIGLLVLKACDYARQGLALKDIAAAIRNAVPKVKTSFVIDTLEYLYKGGRCSALQNIMSSVFKIKPVVKVENGKMLLGQKVRGSRLHALQVILEDTLRDKENIQRERVMITHSMGYVDAKQLRSELQRALNINEVIITNAGCVISSHCGPGTVGILYLSR